MNEKKRKIGPLMGIDNSSARDDALQVAGDAPAVFLRDAVNVTLDRGRASMRPGLTLATTTRFQDLWQSPLHQDVFGRLGDGWVKVDPTNWSHTTLATVGDAPLNHIVLNGRVLAAGATGLFEYDGATARRFPLDVAVQPFATIVGGGSLPTGRYSFATTLLRAGMEGPTSPLVTVDVMAGGLELTLTAQPDPTADGVRLYMTTHNGGELLRVGDFTTAMQTVPVMVMPPLGAPPPFLQQQPMPSGRFLCAWRGRLVVAQGRTLRFSEPLAYHIHSPSTGHVTLPQRITFVEPVEGGVWVGQVDGVVFLAGSQPADLSMTAKSAQPPLPSSSTRLKTANAANMAEGGREAVAWLTGIGFVIGTADGMMIEPQAKRIAGITGSKASTVVLDERLLSAVS